MTDAMLDDLQSLSDAATPGPWYVRRLNDEVCMSGLGVSTVPDPFDHKGWIDPPWPESELVAACLVQEPPLVLPADKRYEQNTKLIAAMRTTLPELIRLARIGLAASGAGPR